MARLDVRRRLPSLVYPRGDFYRGAMIWNGTDCSSFLPDFYNALKEKGYLGLLRGIDIEQFDGTRTDPSHAKLFGPSSSTVKR